MSPENIEAKMEARLERERQFFRTFIEGPLDITLGNEYVKGLSDAEKLSLYLKLVNGTDRFKPSDVERPNPSYAIYLDWLKDNMDDEAYQRLTEDETKTTEQYKGFLASRASFPLLKKFLIETKGFEDDVVDPEAEGPDELGLEDIPVDVLEEYYKRRPQGFVGLHVSPAEIRDVIDVGSASETKAETVAEIDSERDAGGISTGWTWYALDAQNLYPDGDWLYIVDSTLPEVQTVVEQGRDERSRYMWRGELNWVGVTRPLQILARLPLTPKIERDYGMKRTTRS